VAAVNARLAQPRAEHDAAEHHRGSLAQQRRHNFRDEKISNYEREKKIVDHPEILNLLSRLKVTVVFVTDSLILQDMICSYITIHYLLLYLLS